MATERERRERERERERERAEAGASVWTILGAVGGAMIVAAFLAPMFQIPGAGASRNEAQVLIADYQREFDRAREELSRLPPTFQEMVTPATEHVAAFLEVPSLKNLVSIAVDARALLEVSAAFDPEHAAQMREVRGYLLALIVFALAMPAIGVFVVVRGVLRGFRKPGVVTLVLSFLVGLVYFAIGALLLLGIPEASRDQVGLALWLLGGGGLLLFLSGIFAVSWRTWWLAYLLDVAGLVGLGWLGVRVFESLNR
ncbi:MAG: hypothetical protein R3B09_02135 [Nannocystaceae bacterium]